MDEIDSEILRTLCMNARIPFSEIAKQLGISPQMVIRRYNNLKKTAISRSSITINLQKLGFKASVSFSLKIKYENHKEINQIYDKITKFPNVIVGNKMLGPFDMAFLVPVRDFEEIFEFQERLSHIKGIEKLGMTIFRPHESWPRNLSCNLLQEQLKLEKENRKKQTTKNKTVES